MSKKQRFILEYPIRTSPGILYDFLTRPFGLSQWFADRVDIQDKRYFFYWNGTESIASVLEEKPKQFIRFKWTDSNADEYFEFRVQKSEVTADTALIITDFADEKEKEEQIRLWDSQVQQLAKVIGG